jgi:phytoene dehydrogenase-like protein
MAARRRRTGGTVSGVSDLDAVVVGAGPNGLAAAVALAGAGLSVLVRERAGRVGGGCATLPLTLPGFAHDHCSAIHPLGAASPFFRTLPLAEHGLEWVEPPLAVAHPFDDGTAACAARDFGETGASLDPGDGAAWRALLEPLARAQGPLLEEILGAPVLHLPRRPLLLARFGLAAARSARGLAEARFRGARARALLAGIAAHAVVPLEEAPSAAFGLVLAAAAHGAGWPFPRGGAERIARALAGVLAARGGHVETGAEVRALSDLPRGRATLLDLTPRQVLRIAGSALPPAYAARLARFRYGPGVFKVDWALSGPIPWRAEACRRAGTVHLGGPLEEVSASMVAVERGEVPPLPFTLLAQQSLFDPSRAPAGKHTAWAYCHVPNGWKGDATAAIEAQVERFAPGFRDLVLARASRGPATLEAENPNLVGGDVGAGRNDLRQLVFRPVPAPDPWATPVPGLWLCSASTPPGGGVHGMCGFNAARSVLRRFGVRG